MKVKLSRIMLVFTLLALGACTTTKVTDVSYVKGKLLKDEKSEPIYVKTEPVLSLDSAKISLKNKDLYDTKHIKIYEKVQSTKLNTKGKGMTDSPFWAIIGTPGALILDVISFGTMGATEEIWTKDENQWKTVKKKLENDFIVDEKSTYSNKFTPLAGERVSVYLNSQYVTQYLTNQNGIIDYDLASILLNAGAQPQYLINNQGITIKAEYKNITKSQKISNKNIPERFFAAQFEKMKPALKQRKGRFDNCDFIAKNKREFFECYYQS